MKLVLGRRRCNFERMDLDASEFVEVVQNVFPKLIAGGGFQFCKCLPNSRVLEPLSKLAHSSPEMLRQRVGNARTYIRPLQRDLDLSEVVEVADEVKIITSTLSPCVSGGYHVCVCIHACASVSLLPV